MVVISPCFGKGSGLKLAFVMRHCTTYTYLPLLRQGERIETGLPGCGRPKTCISPCFGKGSGLKLAAFYERCGDQGYLPLLRQGERIETLRRSTPYWETELISPCFGKGSGLKLETEGPYGDISRISPCFGKGSGLKQEVDLLAASADSDLPLLRQGERIETSCSGWSKPRGPISPCFGKGSGLKLNTSLHLAQSPSSPLASARGAD